MNLKKWLSDNKITEVECLVSDIAGIPRGKIVPVEKYINSSSSDALRLPEYVFGQNVTGEYGDSRVLGETVGDVVLKPDVNTARLVPWYKEPTAQIIHDAFYFDGKPVDVSPREVLNKYWKGLVVVQNRILIVGRLNEAIAGTLKLALHTTKNEAQ